LTQWPAQLPSYWCTTPIFVIIIIIIIIIILFSQTGRIAAVVAEKNGLLLGL